MRFWLIRLIGVNYRRSPFHSPEDRPPLVGARSWSTSPLPRPPFAPKAESLLTRVSPPSFRTPTQCELKRAFSSEHVTILVDLSNFNSSTLSLSRRLLFLKIELTRLFALRNRYANRLPHRSRLQKLKKREGRKLTSDLFTPEKIQRG